MQVWLNGSFVDRDQARLSVFDAGLQHGVGLFETMLARHGVVFRAMSHMNRLADSAKQLLLSDRLRLDPLVDALQMTVQRNTMTEARVRLTLTGGDLNMLQSQRKSQVDPTILIVAQPPTVYPDAFFEKGVLVTIADGRDNPFHPMAGHKTLNYWPRIQALQHAAAKRAGEALWFTVTNHLSAGCVSNVFLVKDERLLTPIARGEELPASGGGSGVAGAGGIAIPATALPGITRSAIIELAESMDMPVEKRMLDINDLLGADEVFLTNSSWGVLPVVGVEREKIAGGSVGQHTRALREAWLHLVDQETREEQI